MKIVSFLKDIPNLYRIGKMYEKFYYINRSSLGSIGVNSVYEFPCHFENPSNVFMEENVCVRAGCKIINSSNESVIIKKYSAIAFDCTIITDSHVSVVGVPHILLGASHINDKSSDIIIEEDVWVGANVTLLPGAHLGRGCIVAAGSIVSKEVPPYALVAGVPAKIIGKKFELEDVIRHESTLYTENERMSYNELEKIFSDELENKRTFGSNRTLTENDINKINNAKRIRHFIEPHI